MDASHEAGPPAMGASNGMNLQVMGVLHETAPPMKDESYEAATPVMDASHEQFLRANIVFNRHLRHT